LKQTITLSEDTVVQLEEIIDTYQPQVSILSSVVNHSEEVEMLLRKHTQFHKLSHQSKLPFTIPVGKPETVGADRLAIAAAAVHLFPHQHSLVIALGTCITYNFINKDHQLIGGSISPGMEMRFRAMHEYTAKLPLVKGDWNVPLIGYDTVSNMQSGVILGMAKEIDGIIDAYKARFSNFNAVLTGGSLPFFESHLKNEIFADPELIFKGLYAISQVNYA
ncbi:MAG TPA: type III pantothenate kinase, partial [Flavisolibacter sp.]|nr:type III pantothenate kinase [Flavisolibacter sp.]